MASASSTQSRLKTTATSEMETNPDTLPMPSTSSFDLKIVRDSFVNCIQSDNTLLLCEYTRAYEELCWLDRHRQLLVKKSGRIHLHVSFSFSRSLSLSLVLLDHWVPCSNGPSKISITN
jgi:hypothetical protein